VYGILLTSHRHLDSCRSLFGLFLISCLANKARVCFSHRRPCKATLAYFSFSDPTDFSHNHLHHIVLLQSCVPAFFSYTSHAKCHPQSTSSSHHVSHHAHKHNSHTSHIHSTISLTSNPLASAYAPGGGTTQRCTNAPPRAHRRRPPGNRAGPTPP
jgi:hypothetical protein